MANLLTRIKDTVMADLHEVLDKKEKKNPIALLNQYLRECERETEKVRKLLERQYTLKEEFTREYEQAKNLADKRKRQAEVASQAGEEELYQFAAQEHMQYEERASRLKDLLNQAVQQMGDLERKYEEMKHKLKDMHIRRMELMGRENITRANHQMDKVLDQNNDKNFTRFQEIESYLDRLEHQVKSSYHRSTIDARIAQLEKELEKKPVL
ncbi:phage shock protein A (PspA) family protein [Cytobacillus firmus]|uniref:Phage shock protein A (PspA) family protein n=2 Tax=Cytobacillus TaxID=2675230 RepID=A0A366JV50_CYTFI|nr:MULTISPECIES: PspA/IM30 family protein [Cytobacillus]RBP93097.1 phage shock protein A (PspA) family protein [Cytobacillus firmus]TDX42699.1 phage shock protein A (PspA) family protein [Cytobacillus oceanisediminis]